MDIYGNEMYNIRQTLEKVADTLQGIQGVLSKPENSVTKVPKFLVLLTGAMGLMSIIERIIGLIKGGF